MTGNTSPPPGFLKKALSCRCPRCGVGPLFRPERFTLTLRESCSSCGLDFSKSDCGDGPSVILIFILGALLVPLALLNESLFHPPLWVHIAVSAILILAAIAVALRPAKALVIGLQFRHRQETFRS